MESTRELAELAELSLRFWGALAAASENLAYQLAFNSLRQVAYELPGMAAAQARELRNLRGYRAIAEAVRRRDSTSAERAAREHIGLGLTGLSTLTAHRRAP
jgi:DNA-binding FadR family transcriptional regulator